MSTICSLLSFFKLKFHSWNQSVAEVPPSLVNVCCQSRRGDEKNCCFFPCPPIELKTFTTFCQECNPLKGNKIPKISVTDRKKERWWHICELKIQQCTLSKSIKAFEYKNFNMLKLKKIITPSLCCMTLHVRSKLIMTSCVKAPQSKESKWEAPRQ